MDDRAPLSPWGERLPPTFRRRVVTLPPGATHLYSRFEWRDAIVVIERGCVEVETTHGSRYHFGPGDVLWLDGLPVRSLHNPGRVAAVLVTVSRRTADSF